jgi:hypothetical protein
MQLNVPRYKQEWMTCGPSCLQQILSYYGKSYSLKELINSIDCDVNDGVYVALLGLFSLKNGFNAKIITSDLSVFDPTWAKLSTKKILTKLRHEKAYKSDKVIKLDIGAYTLFLKNGGKLSLDIINIKTIESFIKQKIPVLALISQTSLYSSKRFFKGKFDDIKGKSLPHYVIVSGFDKKSFTITDPDRNPFNKKGVYKINKENFLATLHKAGGTILIIYKNN